MWFLDGRHVSDVIAAAERKSEVIPYAGWVAWRLPKAPPRPVS